MMEVVAVWEQTREVEQARKQREGSDGTIGIHQVKRMDGH